MATIVGDVLQLNLVSTYLGQTLNNIFHFQITQVGSVVNASTALGTGFGDNVLDDIRAITSDQITYNHADIVNIRDVSDFAQDDYSVTGSLTGGTTLDLPSYIGLGFRYNRVGPGQRHGYKRFGGLIESQVSGNSYAGNPTLAADLATALIYNQGSDTYNSWRWSPFVASRPIVFGATPSGYVPVTSLFQGVTTQNSRKP